MIAMQSCKMGDIDKAKLRTAFIVYGAMNRKDWRTISVQDIDFDTAELSRQLIPTLRSSILTEQETTGEYGARLIKECRQFLSAVFPFTEAEREFLDLLLDRGVIDSSLLTSDPILQQSINDQPLLKWKAVNVRKHKGL